jgi:hypothetical protein
LLIVAAIIRGAIPDVFVGWPAKRSCRG